MSKTPRRRSDDEFKPSSAKKAKTKPEEHQSAQRIRLLDLIKCNFLGAGEEVFVKEQEGVITERGTIKVLSSSGYIEYSNPTSWTKQVTGRENGGWGQIRLKSSKQTLSSIKEQYQKSVSSLEYLDDAETKQMAYHPPADQLNSSTSSQPPAAEAPPSDLTLPLKVRFIGDEDRVFKIIWVSPDFKEFHTEYQNNLYTNLADFVNKIFEDFNKPPSDPSAPSHNLRFDELMYELSPGKWVRLAGNIFPSELMAHNGQQGVDQSYQQASLASQPHILQQSLQQSLQQPLQQSLHQPLSYSSTSTPDHRNANNVTNSHTSADGNHLNDTHNTSFDDYAVDDEDEDDEDYIIHTTERKRKIGGSNKGRPHHLYNSSNSIGASAGTGSGGGGYYAKSRSLCYKCLVYSSESPDIPTRVNCLGPTSVKDVMHTVLTESGLKYTASATNTSNGNDLEFLREYNIEIEDQDFGGVKIAFPRSIANFPTKCKITIRRKEADVGVPEQTTEKYIDKEGIVNNETHTEGDKGTPEKEKEKPNEKIEDDETKTSGLLV